MSSEDIVIGVRDDYMLIYDTTSINDKTNAYIKLSNEEGTSK